MPLSFDRAGQIFSSLLLCYTLAYIWTCEVQGHRFSFFDHIVLYFKILISLMKKTQKIKKKKILYFRLLFAVAICKCTEMWINPGKSTALKHRAEHSRTSVFRVSITMPCTRAKLAGSCNCTMDQEPHYVTRITGKVKWKKDKQKLGKTTAQLRVHQSSKRWNHYSNRGILYASVETV